MNKAEFLLRYNFYCGPNDKDSKFTSDLDSVIQDEIEKKVNEITDDLIIFRAEISANPIHGEGIIIGAKWFKNKLLTK